MGLLFFSPSNFKYSRGGDVILGGHFQSVCVMVIRKSS